MRGRPAEGFYTRHAAQAWLDQVLAEARRGELPGLVRTGATFADAVAEYMRWLEQDRARKPTTLRGYESIMRAHLLPAFGERRLEDITADEVEAWSATLAASGMANTTRLRILTCLHGVMKRAKRVWKLPHNPLTDVEKPTQRHAAVELEVFTPEEIHALVRAAESEQDATIFLTAAFTGLRRGELVALPWRSVDFARRTIRVVASYSERTLSTPKSGRSRSVPMAPPVAEALARLTSRGHDDQEDDLVFPGTFGEYLDGSALYRRYKLALKRVGLRPLRFHDLRHTFGTQVISNPAVSILQLKAWMGHANIDTTMKYLHYAPRGGEADLVAEAFARARSGCIGGWHLMPRISFFYGITIAIFWNERGHQTPHFHAAYAGQRASLGLDGTLLAGSLPPRALKLVRRWASLHQAELVANWRRARAQEPLCHIDPLT